MHPHSSSLPAALLRAAVAKNPLFLLSAVALLGGVWLLNPPGAAGGRSAAELLPLLAAVRGYEVALLLAMALLRRAGQTYDVRGLALVLTPFLVDVSRTHALAALLPETWGGTFAACAATFGLTALMALAAGRLAGRRFEASTWVALLTPAALALGVPLASSWLTFHGESADGVAFACGLGLALAIAVAGWAARSGEVRLLSGISLAVLASHVLGTTWSHSGSLLLVAGPTLIALGPALPRLLWPGRDDPWTPLVLPAVGAVCCGAGDALGAWPLGWAAFGLIATVEAVRRRTFPPVLAALLALDLLLAGAHTVDADRLGQGPGEPLALLGLFAWGLARRAHPAALWLSLGLAAALTWNLNLPVSDGLQAVLALDLLGVGFLAWSHRAGARARRDMPLAGVLLLVVPVHVLLASGARGPLEVGLAMGTLLGLLGLGLVTRTRLYQLPALLLPLEGARRLAPSGTGGWGAVGIGAGFGLVAAGVATSLYRERLLAWLDAAPQEPPAEPPAAEPAAEPALAEAA